MGCLFPKFKSTKSLRQTPSLAASSSKDYGTLHNSQEIAHVPTTPSPSYYSPSPYNPAYTPINPPLDITYTADRKGTRGDSIHSKKGSLRRGNMPIRIATWNLLLFSKEKASHPEVLKIIVDIILANQLDLIAVQELSDKIALKLVCDELNRSKNGVWKYKVSERAGRMFQSNEYLGYIWNTSKGLRMKSDRLLTQNKSFARSPYLAKFIINKQNMLLVNVHLKAVGLAREDINRTRDEVDLLSLLIQSIYSISDFTSVHTFLLGDFNLCPDSDFDRIYQSGFQNLLAKGTHTNISARNPRGSMSYDNIWVSLETLETVYGGKCGVVRDGLVDVDTRREDRAPTVSDHCPVWATFNL
ncbi:Endonuclease/exonuclease/phosphatase family domain-containing protein 1-like [Oopsacas minuta]|uniref:Endonuclease/exonuclease/phosphatase family domain-containing protein 1-like n=1 Tax=Oopsacas minuta TaxID=111878 RepID=A0AAV7K2V8_9METZ|nr:Endonuclease/exonuclease/phosphatase family domain-containing protein 1-like [Oopsacas minuta]